ncbi:dolichyl-diphosphooligosaccharide-protein glycotransferase [Histomonas meleagridis]|uniref:dolichyl-diphosphooligosaccharide-protein glycotransferase n=1 Tax=Histomonas meleagridis TaxID=135588 RepID=UPI003559B355|nr:dolichyl-diphosphooligosaccharide-protein glycotransferase [Histomonas meleagridis]
MELNSFSQLRKEFVEKYRKQSSLLRGFDAIALYGFITLLLQIVYAGISKAYPFESVISSICGCLGLIILTIALRIHLTPEINSKVTNERAFVDYLFCISLMFLFVWNIMV